MLLPLAYYGDPMLRKKAARVEGIDEALREFVKNLIETMESSNGVGLAATQVYNPIAVFVTKIDIIGPNETWLPGRLRVFINPKIVGVSEQEWEWTDGCLSIPNLWRKIYRPWGVKIEYNNLEGERLTEEFTGTEAWCIMHENDHLNGVLWIDRLKGKERQAIEPILREIKKKFQHKS